MHQDVGQVIVVICKFKIIVEMCDIVNSQN